MACEISTSFKRIALMCIPRKTSLSTVTFSTRLVLITALLLFSVTTAHAQDDPAPLRLTLAEAIEIALINNYALQAARITEEDTRLLIKEAVSVAFPSIEASSSYTRNVREANPFAGSSAGDFFSGFAFTDWLRYNETVRLDDLATTNPITFAEFVNRQQRGMATAGIAPSEPGSNPFSVANQYMNAVNLSFTIFNAPNWIRLVHPDGYRTALERVTKIAQRQEQIVIGQVREAFYGALLAKEEAQVAAQSMARTQASRNETALRVSNGVLPKIDRLTMDVELANQESALIQAQNRASNSLDQLKYLLGLNGTQELTLYGVLEIQDISPYLSISEIDAFQRALVERPDLEEAQLNYRYALNELRANKLSRLPRLGIFANLSYSGRVPDNRTFTIPNPIDPFSFSQGSNSYFSKAYWQSAFNVGFNLNWTIFDGFERRRNIQRAEVAVRQAGLNVDQLNASTEMEIKAALRNLDAAYKQISSQEKNVATAELNYEYTLARSNEGVANTLQVRAASAQLDTSRLNHLRAIHSFLVAQSTLEVALGVPIEKQTDVQMASAKR